MKTKIYLLMILILLSIQNLTYANVDVTNSFGFTYDCTPSGGILHTTFNLGGHHLYIRDYNINNPGIIEIADGSHTTTSKTANVSIDGCHFQPSNCNITNTGSWLLYSSDTVSKTINIDTQLSINKSGNIITIDGKNYNSKSIEITGFSTNYTGDHDLKGKDIKLEFNDDSIKLYDVSDSHHIDLLSEINFTNNIYSGTKEYFYTFSNNNSSIKLKRNIFKKISDGTVMSSNNTYDEFNANSGYNYCPSYNDCTMSTYPDAKGPGYVTGLNYWDFTQHYYTTTKVKIYPVSVICHKTDSSDGSSNITSESYTGTLRGIVQPVFSGPIKINEYEQIQETPTQSGSISIFTASGIKLEGLNYSTVQEVGGIKTKIKSIEFTVKRNEATLGEQTVDLSTPKDTTGEFESLNFNSLKNSDGVSYQLTHPGTYGIEIVFKGVGDDNIGTYSLPLTVVPNNDLKISSTDITGSNLYANNTDKYTICSNITDSFGNPINANYDVDGYAYISGGGFDINSVDTGFQKEGLNISHSTFSNSKFCFDLSSISPGNEDVIFKIKVPNHTLSSSLTEDLTKSEFSFNKNIIFKKPVIAELKVEDGELSVGALETVILSGSNIGNVKPDSGNIILRNLDQIMPSDETNYSIEKSLPNKTNLKSESDVKLNIKGTKTSVSLVFPNNYKPFVTYKLGGQDIKYILNDFNDSDITLSSENIKFNGLQVVGLTQATGKQTVANDMASNFSDLSTSSQRTIIRKKAIEITKGMTSGQIINGVKYIEGDISIYGDQNYETLVVKDGNLLINKNLNTSNKKFGIIVLKDGYDVNKVFSNKGNIYIKPDVAYINAIIYADGGLISANSSGNPYIIDSALRTSTLKQQLVIKGSLFSRNTIGGALESGGQYILPGGSKTTDYNKAMIYDLNYIRRNNIGYDLDSWSKNYNGGKTGNFVIIYNSHIQTDPPKGFAN